MAAFELDLLITGVTLLAFAGLSIYFEKEGTMGGKKKPKPGKKPGC